MFSFPPCGNGVWAGNFEGGDPRRSGPGVEFGTRLREVNQSRSVAIMMRSDRDLRAMNVFNGERGKAK